MGSSTPAKPPPGGVKPGGGKEHEQVKQEDGRVGYRLVAARHLLELLLLLGEGLGPGVHLLQPVLSPAILQDLRKTPQAFQHKAGELPGLLPEPQAPVPAGLGGGKRHRHPHHGVGQKGQQSQGPVEAGDEQAQDHREQHRDGDGRDGVGVEHLQQLDV